MGTQIVKQPDGKFAIWSSVENDFTVVDCENAAEIVDAFLDEQRCRITNDVDQIIAALERGKKPYQRHTKSFDECIEWIREVHGNDADSLKYFKR